MTTTPGPAELLERVLDARMAEVYTALPGTVQAYSATTQRADIRVAYDRTLYSDTEARTLEALPVLPSVPVVFPRGGGFYISFPVTVGDTGLLIFTQRALGAFMAGLRDPGDARFHGLAGATFHPGLSPSPIGDASGSEMALGYDGGIQVTINGTRVAVGGTADAAALASKVDAAINAIVGTTIVPNDGGAAIKAAVTTAWSGVGSTCVSTQLKVGS